MELQQILVYDNQNYFFRFLKYEFDENFEFKKIKKNNNFNEMSNYIIVVFVMYSESEFLDFLKLYNTGVQILVATYNKELLSEMERMNNVILLDTSKAKKEIARELSDFFNCLLFQKAQVLKYNTIQNN